jgi:hypothetical protein
MSKSNARDLAFISVKPDEYQQSLDGVRAFKNARHLVGPQEKSSLSPSLLTTEETQVQMRGKKRKTRLKWQSPCLASTRP